VSERYLRRVIHERGWTLDRTPAAEARTFWSTTLGAILLARAGAACTGADLDLAGTLTIRDTQAEVAKPSALRCACPVPVDGPVRVRRGSGTISCMTLEELRGCGRPWLRLPRGTG
jgi:hypothetical protein